MQGFVGEFQEDLAEAEVHEATLKNQFDCDAKRHLAFALASNGKITEAQKLFEAILHYQREQLRLDDNHAIVAETKMK